jgi:hypothetical protein
MTTELEIYKQAHIKRIRLPEGATRETDPITENIIVTFPDNTRFSFRDKNNKGFLLIDDPLRGKAVVHGNGRVFPFSVGTKTKDQTFGGNGRVILDSSRRELGRVRYLGRNIKNK